MIKEFLQSIVVDVVDVVVEFGRGKPTKEINQKNDRDEKEMKSARGKTIRQRIKDSVVTRGQTE